MEDRHKVNEQQLDEWVEVHPGVFVFQLNGKRGTKGKSQLNDLLGKRSEMKDLSVALVDAISVDSIDTGMVKHLADIINAARLPGTRILLARRDPSIDRKLTHLDVNLSDITMCFSLAAGLWAAMDILELASRSEEREQVVLLPKEGV